MQLSSLNPHRALSGTYCPRHTGEEAAAGTWGNLLEVLLSRWKQNLAASKLHPPHCPGLRLCRKIGRTLLRRQNNGVPRRQGGSSIYRVLLVSWVLCTGDLAEQSSNRTVRGIGVDLARAGTGAVSVAVPLGPTAAPGTEGNGLWGVCGP